MRCTECCAEDVHLEGCTARPEPDRRPVPTPNLDDHYRRLGFTDDDAYDDFRERTR